MHEQSDDAEEALPREWLPDPQPVEGDAAWDGRIERIMAAAAPGFRTLSSRRSTGELTWWSGLGVWWKPTVVAAAASIALLLLTDIAADPRPRRGSLALRLVVSAGDPVTLWRTLGIDADPVLGLIAIREPEDAMRLNPPPTTRDQDDR